MDEVFRPGKTLPLAGGRGTLIGNVWGDAFKSGILPDVRTRLYEQVESGQMRALVDASREFRGVGAAVEAVEHMLAGKNTGKVVLRVSHDA